MIDYDEKREKKVDEWTTEVQYFKEGVLVMTDRFSDGSPSIEDISLRRAEESARRNQKFLLGMGMIFGMFVFILGIGGTGYGFLDFPIVVVMLFGGLGLVGRS